MAKLALLALLATACSSTPGDRVSYVIDGTRSLCELAEKHPAEVANVPPEYRRDFDEVCLALGAAKAEAVEGDAVE